MAFCLDKFKDDGFYEDLETDSDSKLNLICIYDHNLDFETAQSLALQCIEKAKCDKNFLRIMNSQGYGFTYSGTPFRKVITLICKHPIRKNFNFLIRKIDFLEIIKNNFPIPRDKPIGSVFNGLSNDSIFGRLNIFRKRGIIHGRGRNIAIIEPYYSLLKILKEYPNFRFLTNEKGYSLICDSKKQADATQHEAEPGEAKCCLP